MEKRQVSAFGAAWLAQINAALDDAFDDQLARWPMSTAQANAAAMEATDHWVAQRPVASEELVLATLEVLRR